MLNVYNIRDITRILSGIIKSEPALQNVWVQGEVSVEGPSNAFFLENGGSRLRCFVPGGNISKFKPLLKQGNTVVVNGEITLFTHFSQYQIKVNDLQDTEVHENRVGVTEITNQISDIVATPELQNTQIQGKVLEVFQAAVSNWNLCDVDGPPELQIKCVHRGAGPISPLWQVGNNVCVRGNVSIYPSQSRYQIDVTGVGPITENSTEQCQCSGCAQCTNANHQCNRHRETANFESCATCLPRPPDELYKLCPECYAISSDHETEVANAVYAYFDELQVNGFSPYIHTRNARGECKECQIQFGTRNGIADVVLADGNGSFAAIAECKGAGYVGHGIEQLKSYLSATDTRFGIFANKADSNQWKFYENRRRNCVPEIDRSEFELGVVKSLNLRPLLQDEIANLRQEIHRNLDDLLEERMQKLETSLADLSVELRRRGIVNWFKNLFLKENE